MAGVWGTYDPLGKQTEYRMTAHDILCAHTMVGTLEGTDSMFERDGYTGTESHWGVGGYGEARQWQDIAYSADANLDGWRTVLSVETADWGKPFPAWDPNRGDNVPSWTNDQLDILTDLFWRAALPGTNPKSIHRNCNKEWQCYRVGIPASLIPDTKPGRRGFAYHAQGVPGNGLVPGGIAWSSSRGKICPGKNRINQLQTVIIPRVQNLLKPPAPKPPTDGLSGVDIVDPTNHNPTPEDDALAGMWSRIYTTDEIVKVLAQKILPPAEYTALTKKLSGNK
jgi:hypothetical protein